MITLTLLHPLKSVAVQSWTFQHESSIKIGRSTNNEVVLYSAVVSRHHLEIKKVGQQWEVINLGANGTYIDGEKINRATAVDGMIVRLATSGPKILIKIESDSADQEQENSENISVDGNPSSKRRLKISKQTLIS